MQVQDILSSLVYLVPVGTGDIVPGSSYTWIDLTREDPPCYFHPVGGVYLLGLTGKLKHHP